METKTCKCCGVEKPLSCFGINNALKDGHQSKCLDCMKIYQRRPERIEYQKNHNQKEHRKNARIIYKQEKRKDSEYRRLESIKNNIRNKFYYTNVETREKFLQSKREYRKLKMLDESYVEKIRERERNRGKTTHRREYAKQLRLKYKDDPIYALKHKLRNRLRKFVKRRSKNYDEIIGCSWEILKNHIESKFTEGMNWNNWNYRGWHLDHIIPLKTANTEEDVYRLNHYTNLQPLWWKDNLRKSDKISEEWGNG